MVRGNDFDLIVKVQEVVTDDAGNQTYIPFEFNGSDVNTRIVGSYQKYSFPFDIGGNTITITSLPNGIYSVKVLSNTISQEATQGAGKMKYSFNGEVIEKDNNFPVNNLSEYVSVENIQVNDGTIIIEVFSSGANKINPINIIEIEEL